MKSTTVTELEKTLMALCHFRDTSKKLILQTRARKAMSKLRAARTMIEQAEATLSWIEREARIQ